MTQYIFIVWCLVKHRDSFTFIREIGLEVVHCTHLAQDIDQWKALVNTVLNLQVP
jgi:hypothetical protein